MLSSSSLMVVALATVIPAQIPQGHGGYPVTARPAVMYATPSYAPVVVGLQQPCGPCAQAGYGYAGPVTGGCGPCAQPAERESIVHKLLRFITYRPLYKTPCCLKTCSSYRPPLYAWFPPCIEGAPHCTSCVPPANHCASCFKLSNIRFAPPPGATTCPTGTCR